MQYSAKNTISISISFVHTAISKVPLEPDVIDRLLYSSRIPRHLLQESHTRVSLTQYSKLITALMIASDDELLGHSNKPLPIGSLSLLTHWLVSANTMEQVINRLVRFYQILGKGLDIKQHVEKELFHIEIGNMHHQQDSDTFIAEFSFFCIHRILCWLRKEIIPIDQLSFPFLEPSYARDYRPMFYGAPVSFDSSHIKMSFSRELLRKPIQQNLTSLQSFLKDPITELLILNFNTENWASKVGNEIRDKLDALPTLPDLAQIMKIKPYTLQRRLADEGTTYLAIKNQIKRDAAIEMLVQTNQSIEDISTKLGFAETSPFTRTFKQWTGVPPSAYRKYHI
ncbi:MAG: hypothetical protein COA99_02640 [Moraxellaceae bacterium]|nr:MAG: hypothetical protein COA99_02640 [Moraxellaceae bacterium]